MKRKIIEIDEDKCNGCGACVTGCAEGALAIIDGKARLVKEQFCDGLGACIGECPTGALKIIEREAEEFDEEAARLHVEGGVPPEPRRQPPSGGCPGSRMRFNPSLHDTPAAAAPAPAGNGLPQVIRPEINQWPLMLHLVQPQAPYFQGRDLVVLSTCSPVACPDVQWRFLRGRSVVVACPKLDRTEGYVEKLAAIFRQNNTQNVYVVRMEVPCCGGLTALVRQALALARVPTRMHEVVVSLDGQVNI